MLKIKKLTKLIANIQSSEKENKSTLEPTEGDIHYRNFLLYGATVNVINDGVIGKNNPNRMKLLQAQEQVKAVREASLYPF